MVASLRPKSTIFEVTDDSVISETIVVPAQRRGSRWDARAAAVVLAAGVVGVVVASSSTGDRSAMTERATTHEPALATVEPARPVPAPRTHPRPRRRSVPVKHPKRRHRHHRSAGRSQSAGGSSVASRTVPASPRPQAQTAAPPVSRVQPPPTAPAPRSTDATSREFF